MTTPLVLDCLEHAHWTRQRDGVSDVTGLIHHTEAGSQGGFNRSSQHLLRPEVVDDGDGGLEQEDQRCAGGRTSAVAC
jgi:hypothetical protein